MGGGGGWLSERPSVASYSRKIFQVMLEWWIPHSIVYYTIREEILFIALIYRRSFRTRKNNKQLVKYLRVFSKNVYVYFWWNP